MGGAFGVIVGLDSMRDGWSEVGKILAGSLIIMPPVMALVLLLIELIAWRMRPQRTTRWLAGSILLFILVFLGGFVLLALLLEAQGQVATVELPESAPGEAGASTGSGSGWEVLQIIGTVLAGAIVWWSRLPSRGPALAKVFE